jgi:hypothetical protein
MSCGKFVVGKKGDRVSSRRGKVLTCRAIDRFMESELRA